MATIKVKDGDDIDRYFKVGGLGTEIDPYVPIQDVNIQDQTTEDISLFLGYHKATDLTLNIDSLLNDESIQLSSPTVVPIAGDFICLKEGVNFSQMEIISVTANGGDDYTCSIAMPLDYAFTTSATLCLQDVNIAHDGLATPREYFASPAGLDNGQKWDVTRMIVSMVHGADGDDAKFGDLDMLDSGVYFRVENGVIKNLYNARSNADFRVEGFDVVYPSRSNNQSEYGTAARITFSGQDKRGVVKRLESTSGDKFLAKIRDDLSGLTSFRVKIQGHVVE